MPLAEVREMRERLAEGLWPLVLKAREKGKERYVKALEIFADYAMGFISRREAERRLRKIAGVDGGC